MLDPLHIIINMPYCLEGGETEVITHIIFRHYGISCRNAYQEKLPTHSQVTVRETDSRTIEAIIAPLLRQKLNHVQEAALHNSIMLYTEPPNLVQRMSGTP